ncbi:MAG: type II toxin-antitoxin system RelB/DinJ family antitoxin [Patescibacteria group bacterium]
MKTIINIKTDAETKKKAQELANELGVPLSTVINVYLRQFIRTREFSFSLAYSMSPKLEKIIAEAERDIAEDKNLSPTFTKADEAINWLKNAKG